MVLSGGREKFPVQDSKNGQVLLFVTAQLL